MPKRLIATEPSTAELLEYTIPKLQSDEVLIKVDYASPKHGTDMTDFRGHSPWETSVFDATKRLFVKREAGTSGVKFGEWNLGNMVVGHIIEKGDLVHDYALNDRVATYGGISETIIVKGVNNPRLRKMKESDSWQNAVCYDPAQYALGGVRDANVRTGDEVMVFGLGAIGLIAVELCVNIGAIVYAIDPLENRRYVALELGAKYALDPLSQDIGKVVKELSSNGGADAVIETSGSPYALQQAIRGLAYGGIISYVAFAKEFKGGLNFGEEAHFNNPQIVFSRAANDPNRDHPRWNRARIEEVCWNELMSNRLHCEKIITPVVDFNDCASSYMKYVDKEPHLSIKLGIKVPGGLKK